MLKSRTFVVAPVLVAASALVLAGCASGATPEATDAAASDSAFTIVTSTNVYAQIATEIAGDAATVTPIITSAGQDPHGYEASAADQLTIADADLIIENGGGYDSFIDSLIEASGSSAHVITAAEYSHSYPDSEVEDEHDDHDHAETTAEPTADSEDDHAEDGHDHDHNHIEGFNEHVWYDPHTMEHFAEALAEELGELMPENAADFTANAEAFVQQIAELETSLSEIDADYAGAQVFVTEPVPVYLAAAAGLVDATPSEFSEAVEEGQDVPPATLLAALDIIESGDMRIVIANSQTGGAETTQVIDAASEAGIPVLEFSETLPEGQTYIQWMQQNIEDMAEALTQ